jgi:hypothetical protein
MEKITVRIMGWKSAKLFLLLACIILAGCSQKPCVITLTITKDNSFPVTAVLLDPSYKIINEYRINFFSERIENKIIKNIKYIYINYVYRNNTGTIEKTIDAAFEIPDELRNHSCEEKKHDIKIFIKDEQISFDNGGLEINESYFFSDLNTSLLLKRIRNVLIGRVLGVPANVLVQNKEAETPETAAPVNFDNLNMPDRLIYYMNEIKNLSDNKVEKIFEKTGSLATFDAGDIYHTIINSEDVKLTGIKVGSHRDDIFVFFGDDYELQTDDGLTRIIYGESHDRYDDFEYLTFIIDKYDRVIEIILTEGMMK